MPAPGSRQSLCMRTPFKPRGRRAASKVSQTQADSSPVSRAQNCHVERPRGDPPMDCLEPEWSTETVLETRTGRDGVDPFSYGDRLPVTRTTLAATDGDV